MRIFFCKNQQTNNAAYLETLFPSGEINGLHNFNYLPQYPWFEITLPPVNKHSSHQGGKFTKLFAPLFLNSISLVPLSKHTSPTSHNSQVYLLSFLYPVSPEVWKKMLFIESGTFWWVFFWFSVSISADPKIYMKMQGTQNNPKQSWKEQNW